MKNLFRNNKNTTSQGTVGLGYAIAYYTKKGYVVCPPLNDNQNYDLIIDDGELKRVQVKTSGHKRIGGEYYTVRLASTRPNKTINHLYKFDNTQTDFVFIVCADGTMYNIPSRDIGTEFSITLSPKRDKYKVTLD